MEFVIDDEKKEKFNFFAEFKRMYKDKVNSAYEVTDVDRKLLKTIRSYDLKSCLERFFNMQLKDYSFLMFYYVVKYNLFDILELNPSLDLPAVKKLVKSKTFDLYKLDFDYLTTLRLKLFNLTKNPKYLKAPVISSEKDYLSAIRKYKKDLEAISGNKGSNN